LMYLFLSFTGSIYSVILFFKHDSGTYQTKRNSAVFLICFFLTIVLANRHLYNGWRHIYFIYPLLILLALIGFQYIWQRISLIIKAVFIAGIIIGCLDIAFRMIKEHPFENMYFNPLAGKSTEIAARFDRDYWGLSYRKALEYILYTDKDPLIPICIHPEFILDNYLKILSPEQRKRLVLKPLKEAKYYLTNFVFPTPKFLKDVYYTITVDGITIMSVYRINYHN
jgi:hypothetical protein